MTVGVVLPVKAFGQAKARLADRLDADQRARLARHLAGIVASAAGSLPVHVVCDDADVAAWAEARGLGTIWTPGLGLNGAVGHAVAELARRGVERAVVVHADLPLVRSLDWLAGEPGITLVPDRHDDGTNALSLPTGCGLTFRYGPGSFANHLSGAVATGISTTVVRRPELALDLDRAEDLLLLGPDDLPAHLVAVAPNGATAEASEMP